jgi:hypothetical protein
MASYSVRKGALAAAIACLAGWAPAQQQGGNQPGTKWTEEQLRQTVDLARVGRKLTPKSWPGGARVAVCLSFDDDTEAPLLRDGTTSPTTLSASDFGAESGTPRILKMLDRYQGAGYVFRNGGGCDVASRDARGHLEERAERGGRPRMDS